MFVLVAIAFANPRRVCTTTSLTQFLSLVLLALVLHIIDSCSARPSFPRSDATTPFTDDDAKMEMHEVGKGDFSLWRGCEDLERQCLDAPEASPAAAHYPLPRTRLSLLATMCDEAADITKKRPSRPSRAVSGGCGNATPFCACPRTHRSSCSSLYMSYSRCGLPIFTLSCTDEDDARTGVQSFLLNAILYRLTERSSVAMFLRSSRAQWVPPTSVTRELKVCTLFLLHHFKWSLY